MANIIKANERDFKPNPGRIDNFRLSTDASRQMKGINPENLNFDVRQLNPGEFSCAYHFHRYAEELFVILSGTASLRTPDGLDVLNSGDMAFFEKGESGAHQLYNHSNEPCIYLDIRTFFQSDICEYPDSNKLITIPEQETYFRGSDIEYFDGEENIKEIWENLKKK